MPRLRRSPGSRLRQLGTGRLGGLSGGGSPSVAPTKGALWGGQSLVSGQDSTVLSAAPSTRHSRPSFGVRARSTDPLTPLVRLYEQASDTGYGIGETSAYGFTEMWEQLAGTSDRWFCANHGKVNTAMAGVQKGGTATCYADGQAQAAAGGVAVAAIFFRHGENDTQNNNTAYPGLLDTLQGNYNTDTKAVTGQAGNIKLFCSQNAAYPPGSTSATGATKTGSAQLTVIDRIVSQPTKYAFTTPLYPAAFIADGIHMVAAWMRIVGAYEAKAYYREVNALGTQAVYPTGAVRTVASIVVTFNVPVTPLVWRFDLYQPSTTGNTGALLGFKFFDDSGAPPAVTDVQITAPNQVTVTLASTPTGTAGSMEIRIGHSTNQTSGTGGTPLTDSDTTVDPRGWPLPNFAAMAYALTG